MKSWRLFLSSRWLWLALLGIGLGLRLILAVSYYGNYDETSYEIVAQIMRHGGNVYAETGRYNYTPIWSYILLALSYLTTWTGLPFHVIVRSFIISVDLVDTLLLGYIAVRAVSGGFQSALRYWLNPVAILLVGFHGQFENLAVLPLLLAVALYYRPTGRPRTIWLWMLGTLALLIKHNTLFGVWMLFAYIAGSWRRTVVLMALAIGVFLATFIPYLPAGWNGIIKNVLTYQGLLPYGFGLFLPSPLGALLFFVVMLVLPLVAQRTLTFALPRAMEFSFVGLLAFIFGISTQYYLLPVIFGSLSSGLWYWLYALATTALILSDYSSLGIVHLPPFLVYTLVWLVTLGWFASYFVHRLRHRNNAAHEYPPLSALPPNSH